MIDAISSAKVITKEDTEKIINRLRRLTSNYQAERLENRIILSEHSTSENKLVKYIISDLHDAISSHTIVEFKYDRYNMEKQFVLSNKGGVNRVKPYAIVWNNDYYYLIGEYLPKKKLIYGACHYSDFVDSLSTVIGR